MKVYSYYDQATGYFTGDRYRGRESDRPAGMCIEGEHNPATKCVRDGKVVDREWLDTEVWHAPTMRYIPQDLAEEAQRDSQIRAEISRLENAQHRAVREAALGDADALARVRATDDRIAALRKELARAP